LYSPIVRRICSSTRLALEMQGLALPPGEDPRAGQSVDLVPLVGLGDCREAHDLPILLPQHVADQIVLVQPVHDQNDRTLLLVVEPAVEGMVKPLVGRPPLDLREGLLGLQRVVDDDDVGAAPGQHAADRGGDAAALCGCLELGHRLMAWREAGREKPLIPVAGDDPPAVARQLVGEVLGIADARSGCSGGGRGTTPETRPRPGATSGGAAAG
jgi:hypothetical protein